MSRYAIWSVGPGSVTLSVKAFGMFEPQTLLSLLKPDPRPSFQAALVNGVVEYQIDAATVAQMRTAPSSVQVPLLLLQVGGILEPGAPDRSQWGWGTRFMRGETVLPCIDEQGAPLKLDSHGFRRIMRTLKSGQNGFVDLDVITLR